ncbi:cell growth-regulating nucleolar protein isoform X1 [Hippocampus zosterae]|uniref:cell growth-regulating nucleolar protein isoform X1 n=1 Tax=Hippocampus zosterae TaxID=109293 RepID=UPI00223E512C|nr:cell growth-regulating nucleolar protein isoform X1 [Hippocampus zosterae]
MVFFTCNACGESLKKNQVDKHVAMCRGCQVLSCIDCGKDFWGDDYKNHIKCISEDQKYGGKGYEAKAAKGDLKQQQWLEKIHKAMNKPGVSAQLKAVLKQVSTYDNVPRKKAKFENWMGNSLRITNARLHEEVWSILISDLPSDVPQGKKEAKETSAEVVVDSTTKEKQNGHADTKKKHKQKERKEARQQTNGKIERKSKKTEMTVVEEEKLAKKNKKERKRLRVCEDENEDQNGASEQTSKKKMKTDQTAEAAVSEQSEDLAVAKGNFKWKETIKAVLRTSPDHELPMKKLRKKVLAAYFSATGDANFKTKEEVFALFNQKINHNPKFRVLKDRVRLVQ